MSSHFRFSLVLALLLCCACHKDATPPKPDKGDSEAQEASPPMSSAWHASASTGEASKGALHRNALAALGYYGDDACEEESAEDRDCPGADEGAALIGTRTGEWHLTDWINSNPLTLDDLRGRVVVVRFWTAPGCPFCEKTMPALQGLADEFRDQPVTFVGAFHAKPADSVPDMTEPAEVAKKWNVTFPLAFDRDWKTLRSWWLDGGHRHATSCTFVIGKTGHIIHIHPGPVFHPSDSPDEAEQNRDFLAVRDAIRSELAR